MRGSVIKDVYFGATEVCHPLIFLTSIPTALFFIINIYRHRNNKDIFESPWVKLFSGYTIMLIFGNIIHVFWCDNSELGYRTLDYWLQHICDSLVFFFGYWVIGVCAFYGACVDLDILKQNKCSRQWYLIFLLLGFAVTTVLFFQIEKPFESSAVHCGGLFTWTLVAISDILVLYRVGQGEFPLKVVFYALFASTLFASSCVFFVVTKDEVLYYILNDLSVLCLWAYFINTRDLDFESSNYHRRTNSNLPDPSSDYLVTWFITSLFLTSGPNDKIPFVNFAVPSSYKSGNIDPFTKRCDKKWKTFAYYVPTFISPNMLTLAGLFLCIAGGMPSVWTIWHDYMVGGEQLGRNYISLPWWMYITLVAGILADWILDTMDGELARRTGSQSCTRHVFDHMTDIIQRVFSTVSQIPLLPIRDMPLAFYVPLACLASQLLLFVPFLRYYITGKFQLNAGIRLLSHSFNIYFILSAILGAHRTWTQTIPVACFCAWFGVLLIICGVEYCQQFWAIYKSEFTFSMVMRLLYAPLANIFLLFLYFLIGLMNENPMGTSLIIGFIQATFSNHVHASQFLERYPPLFPVETVVGYCIFFWIWASPSKKDAIIYVGTAVVFVIYVWTCSILTHSLSTCTDNGHTFVFCCQDPEEWKRAKVNSNPYLNASTVYSDRLNSGGSLEDPLAGPLEKNNDEIQQNANNNGIAVSMH